MSIFDKISSLINGSKPEKREPAKVSSSTDETPIVVVENPTQIRGPKPQKVIVVAPVINEPTKLPIKRKTQETVAHYPTKADLYDNIPLNDSNYSKYRRATLKKIIIKYDFLMYAVLYLAIFVRNLTPYYNISVHLFISRQGI